MKKIINKQFYRVILNIIGVYQIFGSLLGFYFLFKDSFLLLFDNPFVFIFLFFALSYGGYCGGILLFKHEKLIGINLSLLNQSFQFIQFRIFGFGLDYVSGTYLAIGLTNKPNLSLYYYQADLRSVFSLSFSGSENENFILINLVAVLIFIMLLYIKGDK